jgi:DNA repair protein RecO (recombination protein O)
VRSYRDHAVVLRQHKLGEADRIVTLLTRRHGLVRAVAKGVRRTTSKFGARYTTGCAVLETSERLAGEEHAPAPRLHHLTVGALRTLASGARDSELVLDAFLLRAMNFAGWAPSLDECATCAAPGPHRAFHVSAGGAVCTHCRPAGSSTPSVGVLDLMSALQSGDWAGTEASTDSMRVQASGLVAAHLQWHLERQLRTLPFVERSGGSGTAGSAPAGETPVGQDETRDPSKSTRAAHPA